MSRAVHSATLLLWSLYCIVQTQHYDKREPPSITAFRTSTESYRDGVVYMNDQRPMTVACSATGTPQPWFEWRRNDLLEDFNDAATGNNDTSQSLTLSNGDMKYEGYYQCVANNIHGTSLSDKIEFRLGVHFSPTDSDGPPTPYTLNEGDLLMIQNIPGKNSPAAIFSWTSGETKDEAKDKEKAKIVSLSKTIFQDEQGNLYFSYVTQDDEAVYRCQSNNGALDRSSGGSYTKISVNADPDGQRKTMRAFYKTGDNSKVQRTVTVLKGQNLELQCFFSGRPSPSVSWGRYQGFIPSSRSDREDSNTKLIVKDVRESDQGMYWCQATQEGSIERIYQNITVAVYAVPSFKHQNKPPVVDLNVTQDDDAVFDCTTDAEPSAEVSWMVNGRPLTDQQTKPGTKFQLSADKLTLTIPKACKNCSLQDSDLMVIQCNASNEYGYAFASGYLNVYIKTEITKHPYPERVEQEEYGLVIFDCEAITDDNTPLEIYWLHNSERIRYTVDRDIDPVTNSLRVNTDHPKGDEYAGTYTCVANNSYSYATADVELVVPDTAPPVAAASSFLDDFWWILVILALLLFIIILCSCCCLWFFRNRGDSYPVDKVERKQGHDPEQDLIEAGFHEYQRPEGHAVKGSRGSLTSTVHSFGGSLSGSMATLDRKYSEDGSFIGQYNTNRSRAH